MLNWPATMEISLPYGTQHEYETALRGRFQLKLGERGAILRAETPLVSDAVNIREISEALARSAWVLAEIPPSPPTLRARIGAMLMRIIRRALAWYTLQITNFQATAGNVLRGQALLLERIADQVDGIAAAQKGFETRMEGLATVSALSGLEDHVQQLGSRLERLHDEVSAVRATLQRVATAGADPNA